MIISEPIMVVREIEFSNWAGLGHVTIPGARCYGVTPTWSEWDYQRLAQPNMLYLLKLLEFCLKKGFYVFKNLIHYCFSIMLIKTEEDLIFLAISYN